MTLALLDDKFDTIQIDPQIQLENAVLCEDCQVITNSKFQCTACGSASLLGLAKVLNRTTT